MKDKNFDGKPQDEKKKKKRRHPVRNFMILVLIVLVYLAGACTGLYLGGKGYNPFDSNSADGGDKETTPVAASSQEAQTTEGEKVPDKGGDKEVTSIWIYVKGSDIVIDGKNYTLDELKSYLVAEYKDGVDIKLIDDQARKQAYDDAEKLLKDLGYKYSRDAIDY